MSDKLTYHLRNAIFDLDGTLVDSAPDIRAAVADAYRAVGIGGIVDIIDKVVIGPPLVEMLRLLTPGLADEQYKVLADAFRTAYDSSPLSCTVPYPGVEAVLHDMRQSGAKLLVATNKRSLATRRVLAKTGLADYFLDVATSDGFPGGKTAMVAHLIEKWRLEREFTYLFGDTVSDMRAAAENGIGAVAVLCGYGEREEVAECQPNVVLESVGGLLSCGQFHF